MKIILGSILFFSCVSIAMGNKCDTLFFSSNGSTIRGYFYSSDKPYSPTLIFTQGFMETGDIWNLGKKMAMDGINVFMFDFRGCFQSEGKQSLMNSQEDIGAAISFLSTKKIVSKYNLDKSKFILGGYSYGGHMSVLYAIYHPDVERVITISGGDLGVFGNLVKSNADLKKGYYEFFQSIRKPVGPVDFEYDDPIDELFENFEFFDISSQTEKLAKVDILMTGGLDDTVVNMEDYLLPFYRKLKTNDERHVQFLIYQTNHSYKNVSEELIKDLRDWIQKE